MAKLKWKGGALVAPVPPAMVSCGNEADGTSNIITIAWTGIVNTVPPKTYISVRPSRHSYGLIKKSGEFAINLTPASLVKKDLTALKKVFHRGKIVLLQNSPYLCGFSTLPTEFSTASGILAC